MTVKRAFEILGNINGLPEREEELAAVLRVAKHPFPRDEWREDDGIVLWWEAPTGGGIEPPYVGTPLDDDFPEWVTHFTPIIIPEFERK